MNIILFGPPGAGKGTQADKIATNFNLHKISTGDLLRNESKNDNPLGRTIKSLLDKGDFVADEIIDNIIEKKLINKKINSSLIFDGYPRNLNQAKKLDLLIKKNNTKISCVLILDVSKDTIIKRILGRQTCTKCGLIFNIYFNPATNENHTCEKKFLEKRSDDSENIIMERFETYLNKTLPILEFYKKQNILHQINGAGEINQIYKEISGIIASLET